MNKFLILLRSLDLRCSASCKETCVKLCDIIKMHQCIYWPRIIKITRIKMWFRFREHIVPKHFLSDNIYVLKFLLLLYFKFSDIIITCKFCRRLMIWTCVMVKEDFKMVKEPFVKEKMKSYEKLCIKVWKLGIFSNSSSAINW